MCPIITFYSYRKMYKLNKKIKLRMNFIWQ